MEENDKKRKKSIQKYTERRELDDLIDKQDGND